MQERFENLPGHQINYRDGNLSVSPPPAPGKSVMILGTATDGPVMSPVAIRTLEQAEVFGSALNEFGVPNGSTLLRGLHEVWAGGARNVHLMRISGKKASVSLATNDFDEIVRITHDEHLGFKTGNLEKQILLPLEPTDKLLDAEIVADGKTLPRTAYTIDQLSNSITIHNDATHAGAGATIYFIFERQVEVTIAADDLQKMVSADDQYLRYRDAENRMNWTNDSVVQVFVDGTPQTASQYTVETDEDGNRTGYIKFTNPLDEAANVEWRGTYIETIVYNPSDIDPDTGEELCKYPTDPADAIVLNGANQHFELEAVPVLSTFKLYANGYEVNKAHYYLDPDAKTLVARPLAGALNASLRARYEEQKTEKVKGQVILEAINAGEIYNEVEVRIEQEAGQKSLIIVKPIEKRSNSYEPQMRYNLDQVGTLRDLVNAINADPLNNVIRATTVNPTVKATELKEFDRIHLDGGDSQLDLTKEELYRILGGVHESGNVLEFGAYDILEHYDVDIVLPQGVYADDPVDDIGDKCFAAQLAQFCAVATMRNSETVGMIPTKPLEDVSLPSVYAKATQLHQDSINGRYNFFMKNVLGELMYDDRHQLIDIGKHIGIVALTDNIVSNMTLGVYQGHACNFIAGQRAASRPEVGITNKTLKGVASLRYRLSVDQLNKLTGARFITVGEKYRDGQVAYYIVDGVTMALPGSDFARMTNMDITNHVTKVVRDVSDPYIGNGYGDSEQASHTTDLQVELDTLVDLGIIEAFTFQIHSSISDRILGNAIIELDIVPKHELRRIKTFVSLRPTL